MNKELKRLVVSTTADSLDYVEGIDNCYGITRLHMTAIHNGTTRVLGKYTDPNVFYFSLEDLRSKKSLPKASMPTHDEIVSIFNKAIEEKYDEIIFVTFSSCFGGTYDFVCSLSKDFASKIRTYVINSRTFGFNQGYVALKVQEMVNKGVPTSDILVKVEKLIKNQTIVALAKNIDYVYANHLVSLRKNIFAKMFHHIPEFKLTKNGYFDMIKNTPFQRIAFDDTFAKVKELIGDKKRKEYLLFHLYTGKEFLETLKEKEVTAGIETNFPDVIFSPAIGFRYGPYLAGYGFIDLKNID